MKKVILILLSVLFLFGMVACSSDDTNNKTAVNVTVDAAFTGETENANSKDKTFKTINEALTYFADSEFENCEKVINLKAGNYDERFTVASTIKNLTIIGEGVDNTKIFNNLLSGNIDTDENALAVINIYGDGFKMKNVFVENTFPYNTDFSTSQKQGIVISANADKLVFYDCRFKSYQDTIFNIHGRQYFENCQIEGCVDFICGKNAPTYYNNCTITTLKRLKNGGAVDTNGGYVTAYRGADNNDDESVPNYGYIINNCSLTFEEGVGTGTVALGRPWRKNSVVTIMNSNIAAHISIKAYYNNQSKWVRYVQMGGMMVDNVKRINKPFEANFKEYNNTGDGAITDLEAYYQTRGTNLVTDYLNNTPADTDDFKMLNEEEAKNYNITNIFAKTNGGVSFETDWNATETLNNFIN